MSGKRGRPDFDRGFDYALLLLVVEAVFLSIVSGCITGIAGT